MRGSIAASRATVRRTRVTDILVEMGLSEDELRATVSAAESRILARGVPLAFDKTVGLHEPTLPASAAVGPHTIRPKDLPALSLDASAIGGADLVVVRTLGEGGMGVVDLVRQRSLQREVAIKRTRADAGEDIVASLLREALFTGYLEHPNIVPVHALGRDGDGRPLMLMKRIEGVSLGELIRDQAHVAWSKAGEDRPSQLADIAKRVCDALAYAHSRGVTHRDIKPDNIMLGEFGEVYLLDWGIASRANERSNDICGSLAYMAPEMLHPELGEIGPRTDVYLVGATLHECFVGAPPHLGTNLATVLASIAASKPHDYGASVAVKVPEELAQVITRAMQADPADRYADAAELGRALGRARDLRAASELARVGSARLTELEECIAGGSATRANTLFSECRFALEQSLRGFPENAKASADLQRVLRVMSEFEIKQRNLAAATALADQLDPLPSELAQALDALRAELATEHNDRQRLRKLDRQLDDSVAQVQRRNVVRFASVIVVVTGVGGAALRELGLFQVTQRSLGLLTLPTAVAVGVVLYRWRAQFLANRINRQRALTLVGVLCAVTLHRLAGIAFDWSLGDITSGDALIISVVAALSALTLRRVYFIAAVCFLISSFVAPLLPDDFVFVPLVGAAFLSIASVLLMPTRLTTPALDAFERD